MGDQALTRGPQNTHGLGPGTWGCTLQDKGDFADVIKEGFRGRDIISDGLRVGGGMKPEVSLQEGGKRV